MFRCILVEKSASLYSAKVKEIDDSLLPDGDVLVDIQYSSLNYKDALAITGKAPVVRRFPMIPGIDLVGTIIHSSHPEFSIGMPVVLNGWGVGEVHWGGFAQKARLKGDWLIPLPSMFNPKQAMAIGTAGYTAMLCIMALEHNGVTTEKGDILVTGASGGVGRFAVAMLSKLGYNVIALTGRVEEEIGFLTSLGAKQIIASSELSSPQKPLGKERWAGVIDVVGSYVLANACAGTKYGGVVVACGMTGGMDFPVTVAPFILRGIALIGIDSVMCSKDIRIEAWHRLERDLNLSILADIVREVDLSETLIAANDLLAGHIRGRVLVDVNR